MTSFFTYESLDIISASGSVDTLTLFPVTHIWIYRQNYLFKPTKIYTDLFIQTYREVDILNSVNFSPTKY